MITKQNQELIEKLKTSKVEKDRRWVYSLIAWAIKNQDKDIVDFQQRIGSAVYYAKGKYGDYWNNTRNRLKHDKAVEKWEQNKDNLKCKRDTSTEHRLNANAIYKLYRNGELSKKSTKTIENDILKDVKTHREKYVAGVIKRNIKVKKTIKKKTQGLVRLEENIMKNEIEIKELLVTLIEGLKDHFEEDDMTYMGIDKIRLCQEESFWGNYNEYVRQSMARIRTLVGVLDMSDDEFEKLFDSLKSRWEK